jgi:uncharacterized protein YbcV (DUF1398 family)
VGVVGTLETAGKDVNFAVLFHRIENTMAQVFVNGHTVAQSVVLHNKSAVVTDKVHILQLVGEIMVNALEVSARCHSKGNTLFFKVGKDFVKIRGQTFVRSE